MKESPFVAQKKQCRAGKHTQNGSNTGLRGRCLDCKRDYQREYMRNARAQQAIDSISPRGLRAALNETNQ